MLREALVKARALLRPDPLDRELDAELEYHLEREIERNMANGMSANDARWAARRAFGNPGAARESAHDAWRSRWLDDLMRDVHYALRTLGRNRVFAAVTVVSLAIGIGASATVFSVLDAFFLRRLPVPEPNRLYYVREAVPPARALDEFPHEAFTRLRDASAPVASLAAINLLDRSNVTLSGPSGGLDPSTVRVGVVSGAYFSVMGVRAALGRTLRESDDVTPGGHPVAVISDDYWRRRLSRAPDVLARTVAFGGTTYTIVGVTPRGFSGEWLGRPADFWVPAMMQSQVMIEEPGLITHRNAYWLRILLRLKPGVSAAQAQAVAQLAQQRTWRDWAGPGLTADDSAQIAGRRIVLEPAAHGYSPQREGSARSMTILAMIVALLLLVTCANVAGLMLARAESRRREMAVRLAIGAGAARIARQAFTESLVLATIGGAVGVLVAVWATNALAVAMGRAPVQMFWAMSSWISFDFSLDVRALALACGICVLSGLLFGLAPAMRAAGLSTSMLLGSRGPTFRGAGLTLGKSLVVAQVGLSVVVLVAAGLLARSLLNLGAKPLGFRRDGLVLVWTQPSGTSAGRDSGRIRQLWSETQRRLSQLPGVVSVSALNGGVLTGRSQPLRARSDPFRIVGQAPRPSTMPSGRTFVAPHFVSTLGARLIAGRDFNELDGIGSSRVVIINETMARHYFDDRNPIGHRLGLAGDSATTFEIIGVVKDIELTSPRSAGSPQLRWYIPHLDRSAAPQLVVMCIVLRVAGPQTPSPAAMRDALRKVDPELPVQRINTVDEQLNDVLGQERLIASLTMMFAAVVALLACLGLYGVIAYSAARRTAEIGIRLALGSTAADAVGLVLRDGLMLTVAGLTIGLPLALVGGRVVESRLFGVSAMDAWTLAGVTLVMLCAAGLASFLPARRVSRIDPMAALRTD